MHPNKREALTQTYQQTVNATSGKLYFLEMLLLELLDARDREKVEISVVGCTIRLCGGISVDEYVLCSSGLVSFFRKDCCPFTQWQHSLT
jgi:hypothetical protein